MTEDRDELGGLLRRSAQGAAPLPYDAADTRGRADARRRRTAVAGGVGAAVVAFGVTLAVATTSGGSTALEQQPAGPAPVTAPTSAAVPTPSRPPSFTAAPSPAPTNPMPTVTPDVPPTADPTPEVVLPTYASTPLPEVPPGTRPPQPLPTVPEPTPAPSGELELRGNDLGVTRIGARRAEAVAALSAELGTPSGDPAPDTACVHAADEVAWESFRLAFDDAGRVSGWATQDRGFTTPSGVRVGTDVARLQEVYGDRLQLEESNPDNPESYSVDGVQMVGYLTGLSPSSTVTALVNGDCTGP